MEVYEVKNNYELLMALLLLNQGDALKKCCIVLSGKGVEDKNLAILSSENVDVFIIKANSVLEKASALIALLKQRKGKQLSLNTFHEISLTTMLALLSRQKLTLLEHGEINYTDAVTLYEKIGKLHPYRIVKCLLKERFVGENKLFERVLLKEPSRAPAPLSIKCQLFQPEQLYSSLSKKKRSKLYQTFGVHEEEVMLAQNTTILVTQPFSELGWMTEEKKIQMYGDLIRQASGNTVIKPHPSEKTDYGKCFDGYMVLNKALPLELYVFSNKNIAIKTINSSIASLQGLTVSKMGIEFIEKYK